MSQVNKSYIYVIENTVTGAAYVGKANDTEHRWKEHISHAERKCQLPLYRAMSKYGIGSFVMHVVDEHEDECYVLNVLEPDWISYLRNMGIKLYNLANGGGGCPGYKHSEETKSKISLKHSGKVIPPEQREKIAKALHGRVVPDEIRAKISLTNSGKKKPPRSRAHCNAISLAKKGIKFSDERRRMHSEAMRRSVSTGHPIDDETRKKISEKLRNQVQSEETRRKRSESMKKQTPEMKARRAQSIKAAWARRKSVSTDLEATLLVETCLGHTEDKASS